MKKKEAAASLVRVALYIRVSGDEQKMHGLSLEAQQERLEKFARELFKPFLLGFKGTA